MPTGSMAKFFDRTGSEDHGGPLNWPGTPDGFPFRGAPGDISQEEWENIPLALDYHSRSFRTWVPDEHAAFQDVMDRVVNGWYMQHRRIDRWSDEHGGLLVWLEWVQVYGERPSGKHPGLAQGQDNAKVHEAAPGGQPFGAPPPYQAG